MLIAHLEISLDLINFPPLEHFWMEKILGQCTFGTVAVQTFVIQEILVSKGNRNGQQIKITIQFIGLYWMPVDSC